VQFLGELAELAGDHAQGGFLGQVGDAVLPGGVEVVGACDQCALHDGEAAVEVARGFCALRCGVRH
jgi:hypothetical protein